jgi:hypothetical protein
MKPPCHHSGPIVANAKTGGQIKNPKAGGAKMIAGGATATTISGGGRTTIGGGTAAPSVGPIGVGTTAVAEGAATVRDTRAIGGG